MSCCHHPGFKKSRPKIDLDTLNVIASQCQEMYHDWTEGRWRPVDGWFNIVRAVLDHVGIDAETVEITGDEEWHPR